MSPMSMPVSLLLLLQNPLNFSWARLLEVFCVRVIMKFGLSGNFRLNFVKHLALLVVFLKVSEEFVVGGNGKIGEEFC